MKSVSNKDSFGIRSKGFALIFPLLICIDLATCESSIDRDLTITLKQSHTLEKFKTRILPKIKGQDDYMKKDLYLVRWLRVKDFNIQAAEEALLKNIQWRKENRMDTILEEDFSDFEEKYPYWLDSKDKEGKPMLFFHAGSWDVRRVALTGESDRFIRYIESGIEKGYRLVQELEEKYQNVTQGILMVNIDGYNLVEHGCLQCIPIILRGITAYELHYPGFAEKVILINTPSIFEPLLNAIRVVISSYTNQALHIFGKNQREWSAYLNRYFEWSELPLNIGGSKIYPGMDDYFDLI